MTDIFESVNYVETKNAVKNIMNLYKLLLLRLEENQLPKMTAKYGLSFGGRASVRNTKSSVESYVIKKIILEGQIEEYVNKIISAFNRLDEDERKYLYLKYLTDMTMSDEQIMPQCHMCLRNFGELKKLAYIKFALALGVEVYS